MKENSDHLPENTIENISKTMIAASYLFPNETWVYASDIKFKYKGKDYDIPGNLINIKIAESKLTSLKNDEKTLAKEIRQAHILTRKGDCVYLIPKMKNKNNNELTGPDAILNGELYEFKTITGNIDRVEKRFRVSRKQCNNVFLRITNPKINKDDILERIHRVLNDPKYTRGTKGFIIIHIDSTNLTYRKKIRKLK